MKKSIKAAILSAAFSLSIPAFSSGVPTIDAANMGQMLMQFERLGEQLNQMTETVNQVTQQTENFIGSINYYKDLISNIEFRKVADGYVPVNASEVLAIIEDGVGAANPKIQETIDQIMNSSEALQKLPEGEMKEALTKSRRNMAYYQAAFKEAYGAAGERQAKAHELAEKSATVSNEKEARALGLAMQSENIVAVNEVAKLITMQQMKNDQSDMDLMLAREKTRQRAEERKQQILDRLNNTTE